MTPAAAARSNRYVERPPTVGAEIDRIVVDVQRDVLRHHVLRHLLRVSAHEARDASVRERVLDAAAHHAIDRMLHLRGSERLMAMAPSGIGVPVSRSQ